MRELWNIQFRLMGCLFECDNCHDQATARTLWSNLKAVPGIDDIQIFYTKQGTAYPDDPED